MKNYLPIKICFIMAVTLAISAVVVRLAWEFPYVAATPSRVMIILLILATISVYAFFIYLAIKPSLKTLNSLPVRIWVTIMAAVGLTGGIIHFTNFIPSPEATPSLSTVIAILFLLAGIIGFLLLFWVTWFIRRA
jgi:hypothetical protein